MTRLINIKFNPYEIKLEKDKILTRKGQIILVDPEDWDYFSQFTWHINNVGHAARWKLKNDPEHYPKSIVLMHREIFGYPPSQFRVYHLNGNSADNRKRNLVVQPYNAGAYVYRNALFRNI